jgi:GntR family transcriptional regulator of arabinose operon
MARPSKYTSVAAQIQARIDAGAFVPGEALPVEQELAEQFGVNRLTLRKAVGLLVADGIVLRRSGSGTFVQPPAARGARKGSVLYVGSTTDHFFQAFYEALCREAARSGKGITAFTPAASPEALQQLARLAASHNRLICMEAHWEKVRDAVPRDVHVTLVSGFDSLDRADNGDRPTYAVSTDTYRAVKLAVEYLAGLGHRRIGYVDAGQAVGGDPMVGIVPAGRAPYLGYRAGLQECGLTETGILAVPHKLLIGAEFEEPHYRYFSHHFRRFDPLPTAFVCVGDFRAGPLLRVLRERRLRVPEDVSMIGIGNTPWAQAFDPPLTSVCLGEAELARLALMLNEEPDPGTTRVVRVDPELVVRKSTGVVAGAKGVGGRR